MQVLLVGVLLIFCAQICTPAGALSLSLSCGVVSYRRYEYPFIIRYPALQLLLRICRTSIWWVKLTCKVHPEFERESLKLSEHRISST